VCRAFLKISYTAEEIYPAKIKVYLSIYLSSKDATIYLSSELFMRENLNKVIASIVSWQ